MSDGRRRNPPAKWVLPDVVNPPESLCFTVRVPKNKFYIAAFRGALYNLTSARFWQDDPAHTALQVAAIWRDIFDEVAVGDCNGKQVPIGTFEEIDDMPGLFEPYCDSDGKCKFHFRCDVCGDWHDVATIDDLSSNASGAGNQPAPNGGTASYCRKLWANQTLLIPTPVSTGDTIQVTSFDGAGSDDGVGYFCGGGDVFFINCTGAGAGTNSGDPVPAVNHMTFIVNLAGTFYALEPYRTPFVVPGGVSNVQPVIQVNDSAIANNAGSYDICVEIKNNQTGTWTHTFDFTTSNGGFAVDTGTTGHWTPGAGWQTDFQFDGASFSARYLRITHAFASRTITDVNLLYDIANGLQVGSDNGLVVWNGTSSGTIIIQVTPDADGTNKVSDYNTPITSSRLTINLTCGTFIGNADPGGTATLKRLIISGNGADPF